MNIPASVLDQVKLRIIHCDECKSYDDRGEKPWCHKHKKMVKATTKACKNIDALGE